MAPFDKGRFSHKGNACHCEKSLFFIAQHFGILGECACVPAFIPNYTGKIKENLNRAGYRCQ